MADRIITRDYLIANPSCIFVFGDNTLRRGKGGAAVLRDLPNTYGFITKKEPTNAVESFYTLSEYREVFDREVNLLLTHMAANPTNRYLISKLGGGLANRFHIWDTIIEPWIKTATWMYADRIDYLWENVT